MTKFALLDQVISSVPAPGEDWHTWYLRWLELVRETERVRGMQIEDDVKCAVVIRRVPKKLQDHVTAKEADIADRFPHMHAAIAAWSTSRRALDAQLGKRPVQLQAQRKNDIRALDEPVPMDVGYVGKGCKKGKDGKNG